MNDTDTISLVKRDKFFFFDLYTLRVSVLFGVVDIVVYMRSILKLIINLINNTLNYLLRSYAMDY